MRKITADDLRMMTEENLHEAITQLGPELAVYRRDRTIEEYVETIVNATTKACAVPCGGATCGAVASIFTCSASKLSGCSCTGCCDSNLGRRGGGKKRP